MSNAAPFPVRSVTAQQLGFASAAEHPFAGIVAFGDAVGGFFQAVLDGAVSNDASGAMTYQYWQQLIATGGRGLIIDRTTGQWTGGEQIPSGVQQWFTAYLAIPYQPNVIGATIPAGKLTVVAGQPLPPPVPNFGLIQRIRRLIDSGTTAAWTPPGGGGMLPADPGVSSNPNANVSDLIILLETAANSQWSVFVAFNAPTLSLLPNAPYPELFNQAGGAVVQLSDGSIPGGLSALDNGPQNYATAVVVNPTTGIGTVVSGTYNQVVQATQLTQSGVTTIVAPETQPVLLDPNQNAGAANGGSPAVGGQATTGPGPGGALPQSGASVSAAIAATTTPPTPAPSSLPSWVLPAAIAAGIAYVVLRGV